MNTVVGMHAVGEAERGALGRPDRLRCVLAGLEQRAPALISIRQKYQERHLANPVTIGVHDKGSAQNPATGPCAIRMGRKEIALAVAIEPKPRIEAQRFPAAKRGRFKKTFATFPDWTVNAFLNNPVEVAVVPNSAGERNRSVLVVPKRFTEFNELIT